MQNVTIHPKFNSATHENDMAVLQLHDSAHANDAFGVHLSSTHAAFLPKNVRFMFVGWENSERKFGEVAHTIPVLQTAEVCMVYNAARNMLRAPDTQVRPLF